MNMLTNTAAFAAKRFDRLRTCMKDAVGVRLRTNTSAKLAFLAFSLVTVGGSPLAQTAISDDVIRIGVLTDFSGPFSETNGLGSLRATQLAVEDFGSTVLGKKIEIIYFDHKNKTELASTKAREWFDREGVDMIVDIQNSSVALAVAKIAAEKKKIAIVVGAGSSRISNEDCTPYSIQYAYNTAALANVAARAVVTQGGKSWFFITVDYAFGHALEQDAAKVVKSLGGEVKGAVRHPLNASDFSSFVLQAKASKAEIVGLADSGVDFSNALKSTKEFGLSPEQKVVGLLVTINDVHGLGLEQAQGLTVADGWYWDMNEETRAFSHRYFQKMKRMPSNMNAAIYSSTLHYLRAVKEAQSDKADDVMPIMKKTPVNDVYAKNGVIRSDGAMVHDMFLLEVKKPSESKYPWDYYKVKATVKAEDAFQSLANSKCPLVAK